MCVCVWDQGLPEKEKRWLVLRKYFDDEPYAGSSTEMGDNTQTQ